MKQPKLTAIIQSCRLTLFEYIMRMDDNADAKRIPLASPPADWRRQLGRPRITWLDQHRPTGSETSPPYAPRSSRFGSEPPSVEDDVDVWRYAMLELHARNDNDDLLDATKKLHCLIYIAASLLCASLKCRFG